MNLVKTVESTQCANLTVYMNKNNMLMQMPEITGIRRFSAGPDENDSGILSKTSSVWKGLL